MLQIRIIPTNPEYAKYVPCERFTCDHIKYLAGKLIFYNVWGESGWTTTLNVEDGYFEVDIKTVM